MSSVFNIPIINYHKISDQSDIGITSRKPRDFKNDLALLADLGYQTITFRDLALERSLPPKPVILTFDDGYQSVLENAYPLMEKFGFKGVVYMPTDFIGKTNDWDVQFAGMRFGHLSQDDLRFLHRQGFEIGSHGCSHRSLTDMKLDEARKELETSKAKLEAILSDTVYSISYPFGRFNIPVLQFAKKIGYRFGVTAIFFRAGQWNGYNPLALRRLNIYRMDSRKAVELKLRKQFHSFFAYRDWLIQKGSLATVLWQKWFRTK